MSPIFHYPRSLLRPGDRTMRRAESPTWVGPVVGSSTRRLADVLALSLENAEASRATPHNFRLEYDLSRDGTRKVFTGRRFWQTSIYPSRKMGRPIICEGLNELRFAEECELDPGVASYATQAVLFHVLIDGIWRRYHADFCRLLSDGRVEIVEVKSTPAAIRKLDYIEKLNAVRHCCEWLGWSLVIAFGEDLRAPTFQVFHVGAIQRHRFLRLTDADLSGVRNAQSAGRARGALRDLACGFSNQVAATAGIAALMCRGVIHVDLTGPITWDSSADVAEGALS